jgi:hypothetical protein
LIKLQKRNTLCLDEEKQINLVSMLEIQRTVEKNNWKRKKIIEAESSISASQKEESPSYSPKKVRIEMKPDVKCKIEG